MIRWWSSSILHNPAAEILQPFCLELQLWVFTWPVHSLYDTVPTYTLEEMRTKAISKWTLQSRTPCGQIQLHSLQESSGSLRETIETHSLFLLDFNSTMKSHTQHIKENVWQEANIHEHINITHRESTQTMNLNQSLLLIKMSVHGCSSYSSLLALFVFAPVLCSGVILQ